MNLIPFEYVSNENALSSTINKAWLSSKNLEHLGLVAGFCKEIGIASIVDKALPEQSEQKNISYGQLLEAMILNGLGFTGRTLHMYSQYFQDKPLERTRLKLD